MPKKENPELSVQNRESKKAPQPKTTVKEEELFQEINTRYFNEHFEILIHHYKKHAEKQIPRIKVL